MRAVDLYRRTPDAETRQIARVSVASPGAAATVEVVDPEYQEGVAFIVAQGAPDGRGRQLGLEDGEAFLDALLQFYVGSRLWAEPVDAAEVADGGTKP